MKYNVKANQLKLDTIKIIDCMLQDTQRQAQNTACCQTLSGRHTICMLLNTQRQAQYTACC